MPLSKSDTGQDIRNLIVPNSKQKRDCREVIRQLQFADLGRGASTLHTEGVARLDMQGRTTSGGANLQVQIAGFTAAAIVENTVELTTDPMNQIGASRAAKNVLNLSLDTGKVWILKGTLP